MFEGLFIETEVTKRLDEYSAAWMDKIYDNGKISIWSSPHGKEGKWYFKVFDKDVNRFCRISMTEPKILGYNDELLKLDQEDVDDIIWALSNVICNGRTGWYWIIYENNLGVSNDPNYIIPETLAMPNYTQLLNW